MNRQNQNIRDDSGVIKTSTVEKAGRLAHILFIGRFLKLGAYSR